MRNYVGGQWVASSAADSLPVLNPATGEHARHDAALDASRSRRRRSTPPAARFPRGAGRRSPTASSFCSSSRICSSGISTTSRATITLECGKTLAESRGEMRRAIENVDVACGTPILIQGYNSEDIAAGIDEIMIRQPLGVCAVVAPFNFPGMIPFWFIPYAIACGNTVVIKPSERVPLTMQKVFELVDGRAAAGGAEPGERRTGRRQRAARSSCRAVDQLRGLECRRPSGLCASCRCGQARAVPGGREESCRRPARRGYLRRRRRHRRQRVRLRGPAVSGNVARDHGRRPRTIRSVEAIRDKAQSRVDGLRPRRGRPDGARDIPESRARIVAAIDQAVTEGARPLADGRNGGDSAYQARKFRGPDRDRRAAVSSELTTTEIFGPVLSVHHVETPWTRPSRS